MPCAGPARAPRGVNVPQAHFLSSQDPAPILWPGGRAEAGSKISTLFGQCVQLQCCGRNAWKNGTADGLQLPRCPHGNGGQALGGAGQATLSDPAGCCSGWGQGGGSVLAQGAHCPLSWEPLRDLTSPLTRQRGNLTVPATLPGECPSAWPPSPHRGRLSPGQPGQGGTKPDVPKCPQIPQTTMLVIAQQPNRQLTSPA